MRRTVRSLLLAGVLALSATAAHAQALRLDITSREPMNNGQAVGSAGPFELIRGKVHGAIDPKDPHNTIIQDLDLAPRNARGQVEYVATFAHSVREDDGGAAGESRPAAFARRALRLARELHRAREARRGAGVRERFLLPEDAERIVHEAEASHVLPRAATALRTAPR